MTVIDKILVLFDDKKQRTLSDVCEIYTDYSSQVISSTIGRLVSKGWLKTFKDGTEFGVSGEGREYISLNLDTLSIIDKVRKSDFYLLLFNIPEKQRLSRDIFRVYLKKTGFGQLQKAVWIYCKEPDREFTKLIKDLKIEDKIIFFKSKLSEDEADKIIKQSNWNFNGSNKSYRDFIISGKKFLASKNKNQITARNLVYQLSIILRKDPILPFKYYPKDFLAKQALEFYPKIRKYCY